MTPEPPVDPADSAPEPAKDAWEDVDYRRLIAWSERMERESPLLGRLLDAAPDLSLLDVGCGTGEHVAWAVGRGARGVGVDRSGAQVERAREYEGGRFFVGDATDLSAAVGEEPPFGVAICLGNTLPHVLEDDDLDRVFDGLRAVVRPGGSLVVQLLHYEKILDRGIRAFPISLRPGDDGAETAFVRLMQPTDDGKILFFPTLLSLDPEADVPVTLRSTKRVVLRPWTRADLEPRLRARGFEPTFHGDLTGAPLTPDSPDLVVVASLDAPPVAS